MAATLPLLIAGLVTILLPANAFAASSGCTPELLVPRAVVAANQRFEAAMLASDATEMDRLLDPEFLFVTSVGDVRDKRELLRSYGAHEVRLAKFESKSIQVRIYGSAAILNADVTKEGDYGAGPRKGSIFSGRYRFTRVYVCGDQGWRLVSTHESRLAD